MLLKLKLILLLIGTSLLFAQSTKTKTRTDIYSAPNETSSIGSLSPETKITKLKLDKSGKYVKATIEFYIPVEALKDGRVSLPIGTEQIADGIKFKLMSAKKNGKQVSLKLKVSNARSKSFDFSAMTQIKIVDANGNKAELNPFEGNNTVLFGMKKNKSVTAQLVYNFKKAPQNVEMICSPKMRGGEQIFYRLGF